MNGQHMETMQKLLHLQYGLGKAGIFWSLLVLKCILLCAEGV